MSQQGEAQPPVPDGFCWSHYEVEDYEHAWLVCGECFHSYPSEQALLDDHNAVVVIELREPARDELGDMRYFCAHCVHDF
jgi:hypothetical protein